ncbi:TerC family protein [Alcanivorax quisquiliarum]|uniref:TerC family protein n=1 Tax=Alcanivorax quisquiliarum TaxID=2933565 RepID=A0ABT0E8D2_9GAMM|nr:TerC family protein [Alcanivorax quisquiliarum]MCK0538100.1 TerC family protein [Alcanivorax quisquiliarum]
MQTIGTWWMWAGFAVIVLVMLAIDLMIGGGKRHRVSFREAATWSVVWVAVSLAFAGGLWFYLDQVAGRVVANDTTLLFLTGYVLEKSLAVDNVFVWMLIFSFFSVPADLQRRVLLYGILGAIVLRTIMIFGGSWLISQFEWILYIFGAFLVFTGIRMLMPEKETDLSDNVLVKFVRRHYPVTEQLEGERFFVMRNGVRFATPLFLALVLVEISDVVFAVDSIPAIFAITTDPFIVLTSNIFAILGLRAMYFLLAGMAERFSLLKYGLAAILVFIGTKMLLMHWFHLPVLVSLGVIVSILALTIILSLRRPAKAH